MILHLQEIDAVGVELIGPEMRAGLRVDELSTHPHAIATQLLASLQHIAHAEIAAHLLHIDGLSLVGEGGASGDHKAAADPGETGGQLLGKDIGEIVLRRIATQIGERQDDD
jgi:hypothetical protein